MSVCPEANYYDEMKKKLHELLDPVPFEELRLFSTDFERIVLVHLNDSINLDDTQKSSLIEWCHATYCYIF